MSNQIPKEDLKAINKTFDSDPNDSQVIRKDIKGRVVGTGKILNSRGFEIKSFFGKVLKHDKSWIPVGGKQIVVAKKGQKFEHVPEDLRGKVFWQDSDFE